MRKTLLPAATALAVSLIAPHSAAAQDLNAFRMSQVGFETQGPKTATLVDASPRPLAWRIVDAAGQVVAQGHSRVFGADAASGDHVHIIEFPALQTPGDGYRLSVGGHQSRPFRIDDRPHRQLKADALAFFYQNRAGIPILAEHVARPDLARAAGHAQEIVSCFAGRDIDGVEWPGCDYSLDVTGGWYDAGDHGKYVVNAGISVWTLLNAYERAVAKGTEPPFADGRADIPEAGNGVNDLLDEARYEIEFMLRMQIPDGKTAFVPAGRPQSGQPITLTEIQAGGMVHHKVHDGRWTAIPTAPADDHEVHYLYPPSTGATLNLAAVGAQCARIWRSIDVEFARRCASASQRAFRAALRNRQVFASDRFDGGGPYGDDDFSDDFYWAAAELFVSTGSDAYLSALRTSPYYLGAPRSGASATGDPSYSSTAALGSLSLALAASALPEPDRAKVRENLAATAREYVNEGWSGGYGLPYGGTHYGWGSNGALLNRTLILGAAFDFTGDWNFRNAVIQAVDYLLGRNALDQSYVSGHGARPIRNPHHRFWAKAADAAYPEPPAGVVSGGPNSENMADDVAKALQGHCKPQACWVDDIRAYSLNEVAINWNAPLVWATAFLDDR